MKRNEKHYKDINVYPNWYTTHGIPKIELEIKRLKHKIEVIK